MVRPMAAASPATDSKSVEAEFDAFRSKYSFLKDLSVSEWRDVPEANAMEAIKGIALKDSAALNRMRKRSISGTLLKVEPGISWRTSRHADGAPDEFSTPKSVAELRAEVYRYLQSHGGSDAKLAPSAVVLTVMKEPAPTSGSEGFYELQDSNDAHLTLMRSVARVFGSMRKSDSPLRLKIIAAFRGVSGGNISAHSLAASDSDRSPSPRDPIVWKASSDAVRARDGEKCVITGAVGNCQAVHLIPFAESRRKMKGRHTLLDGTVVTDYVLSLPTDVAHAYDTPLMVWTEQAFNTPIEHGHVTFDLEGKVHFSKEVMAMRPEWAKLEGKQAIQVGKTRLHPTKLVISAHAEWAAYCIAAKKAPFGKRDRPQSSPSPKEVDAVAAADHKTTIKVCGLKLPGYCNHKPSTKCMHALYSTAAGYAGAPVCKSCCGASVAKTPTLGKCPQHSD